MAFGQYILEIEVLVNRRAPPDTFSRAKAASVSLPALNYLKELQESLCHPGVTRLAPYVKVKNLPFSLNDVKSVTQA